MFKKILTIAFLSFSSFASSTLLTVAAKNGYIDVVQRLISAGDNVDATDENGYTALLLAAMHGHTDVVQALVIAGADINALANGESTPLHLATMRGHANVVDALLQVPDIEVDTPGHDGHTQIQLAAARGHTAVVIALLNAGVDAHDPYDDTATALHFAAANGHVGVVKALLAAPVVDQAVSDPGAIVNQMDQDERTPLHDAVEFGHADIVEILLLVTGVDADVQDYAGNSPLHDAAKKGHIAIFLTLLAHGADSTITNKEGHIPLMGATPAFRSAVQKEKILAFPLTYSLRIPKGLVTTWKTMEHQIPVLVFGMLMGTLSPLHTGDLAVLPIEIWRLILSFLKIGDVYIKPLFQKKHDDKGPGGAGGQGASSGRLTLAH